MTEKLLQFIWQWRYFNHRDLRLQTGESLQILSPGKINVNQGPDFLWATMRVGNTLWAGHVELHILASDWQRHAHEHDRHYCNVILHVVWENDRDPKLAMRDIPILVLRDRVPKLLLARFSEWMDSRSFVPCVRQLPLAGEELWAGWKMRLLEQRLLRKTLMIRERLEANKQDWAATTRWLMARNFGLTVNGDAFGELALSLPIKLLARYRDKPAELEALLLGQAGLSVNDPLYQYLRAKHGLRPINTLLLYSRMRPAHSPLVRLRQLAGLLQRRVAWFSDILEAIELRGLLALLDTGEEELAGADREMKGEWRVPGGKVSGGRGPGRQMKESIVINSFLPILYAYGCLRSEETYRIRALQWMREIRAEDNVRTRGWMALGVANRNAADSQALTELKACYCETGRCLDCAIGKALLRRG